MSRWKTLRNKMATFIGVSQMTSSNGSSGNPFEMNTVSYKYNPQLISSLDLVDNNISSLPINYFDLNGNEIPELIEDMFERYLYGNNNLKKFVEKYNSGLFFQGEIVVIFNKTRARDISNIILEVVQVNQLKEVKKTGIDIISAKYNGITFSSETTSEYRLVHIYVLDKWDTTRIFKKVDSIIPDLKNSAAYKQYNKEVLEGSTISDTVFSFEGEVSDSVREKIQSQFKEKYRMGGSHSGKPLVLGAKVKVDRVNENPKDVSYLKGNEEANNNIAVITGVPNILLDPSNSKYSNYQEALEQCFINKIIPNAKEIYAILNIIIEQYDVQLHVEYDDLPIFDERYANKVNGLLMLEQQGIITADDVREELGYAIEDDELEIEVDEIE